MTGLNDRQIAIVREAAGQLPPDKRGLFMERVGAMLRVRRMGVGFSDDDVIDCCGLARFGLVQTDTAA